MGVLGDRLVPPPGAPQQYMEFGWRVAAVGDLLVCTARSRDVPFGQDGGAAYIYKRDPITDSYACIQQLTSPNPIGQGRFGYGLAIDELNGRVAIGAPGERLPQAPAYEGAVYVADLDANGQLTELQRIMPAVGDAGDFGFSLDFTESGALLVGDPEFASPSSGWAIGGIFRYCGPTDDLRLVEVVTNLPALSDGTLGTNVVGTDSWYAGGIGSAAGAGLFAAGAVPVFDASAVPTCDRSFIGEVYCDGAALPCPRGPGESGVGCPGSTGRGAALRVRGRARLGIPAADGFVAGMPPGALCVMVIGDYVLTPTLPAARPLGEGFLCVSGVHGRLAPRVADQGGAIQFEDLFEVGEPTWLATARISLQCWYRDTGSSGPTSNLTNAVILRLYR